MKSRAQADKKMKEGKDAVTTGIFNWSKDYAAGATCYEEAYKLYKEAQAHEDCIKALKQLMMCNQKLKDMWAIGRNQQAMLHIYIDGLVPIDNKELILLTQQAFVQFRLSNSTDNGLKLAGKVSKFLISKGDRKDGLELLKLCYEEALEDQKSYGKDSIFELLVGTMLDNSMMEEAAAMYKEKILREKSTNKMIDQIALTYIIVMILNRDIKEAEQENMQLMGLIDSYLNSTECEAACNLIKFYKEGNVAKFAKESGRGVVSGVFPIIILKKLRDFKLPVVANPQQESQSGLITQEKPDKQNELIKDLFS